MQLACTTTATFFVSDATLIHLVMAQTLSTLIKCVMSTTRLSRKAANDGISEKTCEFFKAYKDGEQLRFHYYNSSGTLVGAKIRTKDKEFRCEGEVSTLFGMQNFRHKTTKQNKEACDC